MIVGVPAESMRGERRVALVPAVVSTIGASGAEVLVESGAGDASGFPDQDYSAAGARIAASAAELLAEADIVVRLAAPEGEAELEGLREGQTLVGLLNPLGNAEGIAALAGRGVSAFALELLPRISRAQPMDALTSMATIAGYRAVLLAAATLPKLFPLMMTAAGTVTPARVLVIGAGVAGLQAIATARRLGAVVHAYDVRPAVAEQVESLGARFVELDLDAGDAEDAGGYAQAMGEEFYQRQREELARVVADSDVVISTAAVPGSAAPLLVTAEAVAAMRSGAVIVDLAAETGGNCALTQPGEHVEAEGVTILGPLNLPAEAPFDASQMYARNVASFLGHVLDEGALSLDTDDEIVRGALVAHGGQVVHPRVREQLGLAALEPQPAGTE
ncbi:MAG: Re/Si-specific NAD(P)(+) transhydrogenase subunit alpha [Chloroflexi bacterium]|nr:Re/Si-specific NAD(P)(+) transhydrogenase subunit alpha [Chloroflexota bacterium]